jgi:hypothetical protein
MEWRKKRPLPILTCYSCVYMKELKETGGFSGILGVASGIRTEYVLNSGHCGTVFSIESDVRLCFLSGILGGWTFTIQLL